MFMQGPLGKADSGYVWANAFDGAPYARITETSDVSVTTSWADVGSALAITFPEKGRLVHMVGAGCWATSVGSNCRMIFAWEISSSDYQITYYTQQNTESEFLIHGVSATVDQFLGFESTGMSPHHNIWDIDVAHFLSKHSLSAGELTCQLKIKRSANATQNGTLKGATRTFELNLGMVETA